MKRTVFILLLAAAALLMGCSSGGSRRPEGDIGGAHDAAVLFVNVGKADCAIVSIDGLAYIIDTGTEESFAQVYAALETLGVSSVEAVFISHCHSDHIGGLESILAKYSVGMIYSPAFALDDSAAAETAVDYSVPRTILNVGDTVTASGDAVFTALAPSRLNTVDDNDNSLVLRLCVNGRSVLFTGDMQFDEELTLLDTGADVSADVLKVGNHGNSDATSKDFAAAVSPSIAIFSTDTSVDSDSASSKVKNKLTSAEYYVTQDYDVGILLSIGRDGGLSITSPKRTAAAADVTLLYASKTDQTVAIFNNGDDADISGWFIYSDYGYEVFAFPHGTFIARGQTIVIAARKSALADSADFVWSKKNVWAKKKADSAHLCDPYGVEHDVCPSE